MSTEYHDRRRATRFPATGKVEILFEDPLPVTVEGELIDTSAQGVGITHDCVRISPGLEVTIQRNGKRQKARVMWTRIIEGQRASGCLLL